MTTYRAETRTPDHLSDEALALLRGLLLCQLVEHAELAAECRGTVDELTGQADTDSLIEREIAEASATHYDTVGRETGDALRRMDEGTYGWCQQCSAPIPFERLDAIPHARLCVSCPDACSRLIG
jgi:RNA polymerase-binding transcription factor DksA